MYRIDNILGKETINTLKYLTSEIKSIFCHSTMVDRVAAMLNYFLCHLVGPKKKNFKVSHILLCIIIKIRQILFITKYLVCIFHITHSPSMMWICIIWFVCIHG